MSMIGKPVPDVTFKIRTVAGQWVPRTTADIFKNRTVVLFSLPGAFTPTCSSAHVPGYNNLAPAFRKVGVDEICCVSVNDTFVMNEWAKIQRADNVTFLPDGDGKFTQGMGMLKDFSALGFGMRSWRYSMLVKNGVVDKMFVEPPKEGDPFEVSDAHTMLNAIDPTAKPTPALTIFSMPGCPHCARAKALLKAKDMPYEEVSIGHGDLSFNTIRAVSGHDTTPQIFMDGKLLGGADDLEKYFASTA